MHPLSFPFRPALLLPLLFVCAGWVAAPASAATLNVPSQYATIQAAVNAAANGDTVLIADGTYSGDGNRDIDFGGKNLTVTSVSGAASTIIDCGGSATADHSGNHRGFYLHSGETSAVISGLTIENGYEDGYTAGEDGGGIDTVRAGVTIQNCTLEGNTVSSGSGGGISLKNEADGEVDTVSNCTITHNSAYYFGGGVYSYNEGGGNTIPNVTTLVTGCTITGNTADGGGGIYNYSKYAGGSITVTGCTITGNMGSDGNGNGTGGGVENDNEADTGTITVTNCTITNNTAGYQGSGVYNENISGSSITLTNCAITGNTATNGNGGGVYNSVGLNNGTITLTDCAITSNAAPTGNGGGVYDGNNATNGLITLINCTITGNTAGNQGGGVYNYNADTFITNGPEETTLINCTITGNTAPSGSGGGIYNYNIDSASTLSFVNDIFYGDTGGEVATTSVNAPMFTFCDVQGGYTGTGNIDADPLLINAPADAHLSAGSPCVSAGTPNGAPATDKDGNTRANPPTIGAYEGAAGAAKAATTTTLTSSVNPSQINQDITLTVVVSNGTQTPPTGTVQLGYNGANLGSAGALTAGQITYTLTGLNTAGSYTFTATYSGDANNQGSVGTVTQTVSAAVHMHLLWDKTDGTAALWTVNADGTFSNVVYGPFAGWTAKAIAAAPNGSTYLLWTNTNGQASLWHVTSLTAGGYTATQYGPYAGYRAVSLSVGGDGSPHLLWDKTDGTALLWTINPANGAFTYTSYGPYAGWTARQVASGNTVTDLLWAKADGTASGFRIASNGTLTYHTFGPYAGYAATALSVGPDDGAHLLWDKTDGTALLWNVDFTAGTFTYTPYGPFSGWSAKAIATGPDNVSHILWDNTNGTASLWNVTGSGYTYNAYGPFSGWTAVGVSAGP